MKQDVPEDLDAKRLADQVRRVLGISIEEWDRYCRSIGDEDERLRAERDQK